MKNGIFGIINIGSSAIRMQISEFKNSKERILESIVTPIALGLDTFEKGYITLEKAKETAQILSKYAQKLDEYKIWGNYKAICTSAVRDAQNKYFFINYINTKTQLDIEIIEESQEMYIKYLGVKNDIKNFDKLAQEGLLIAYLSSGSLSISIKENEVDLFNSVFNSGSLRQFLLFKDFDVIIRSKAYEEQMGKIINTIRQNFTSLNSVKYMIGCGSSINLLVKLLKPKSNKITYKSLNTLYNSIKSTSPQTICQTYSLTQNEANVVVPIVYTFSALLKMLNLDGFLFSNSTFPQQLVSYYSKKFKEKSVNKKILNQVIAYSKKYNNDLKHAKKVLYFANKLYSELKSIHSMTQKEKMVLDCACILHDVGYHIGINNHHQHSYYIAKSINIPGIDKEIIDYVAASVLFHRNKAKIESEDELLSAPIEKILVLKKIIALLKIADSLDASHMQIIEDIDINVSENEVKFIATALKIPFLEELTFKNKSVDFLETFGIAPKLYIKLKYE
ncbi:Exopolyphosphatase [Desulfurella amilsii]|uniref:Exopolyphosphatase n=1 Tax=Desulfurella amilsii TaxID=1562698 RepID=A0A1X4XXR8_9BACT|nr:HD domain-containing protein [Desulfurella amilsii]OSS42318.1 Exopolyphosphatase [Desulfurella amilsii]